MASISSDQPVSMRRGVSDSVPLRGVLRKLLASLIATILAIGTGFGITSSAYAAGPLPEGFQRIELNGDGQEFGGVPVFEPGREYGLEMVFDPAQVETDEPVVLQLSGPFTVPEGDLEVPAGNTESIESIYSDGKGGIHIKFKEFTGGASDAEGFELKLTLVADGERPSGFDEIDWTGNSSEPLQIIFKNQGDSFEKVKTDASKELNSNPLGAALEVVNGKVQLKADSNVVGSEVTYTLVRTTESDVTETITDELPAGLQLNDSSFKLTLEQWDENGFNKRTEELSSADVAVAGEGSSFTYKATLPAHSRLTMSYNVTITQEYVDALIAALQQAHDDGDFEDGGWVEIPESDRGPFENVATFPGLSENDPLAGTRTATLYSGVLAPSIPGPNTSDLRKRAYGGDLGFVAFQGETGERELAEDLEFVYNIKADLSSFDGTTSKRQLTENVTVTDQLQRYFEFKVTGDGADPIRVKKHPAGVQPVRVATKAEADEAGEYFVDVETGEFFANLGQDPSYEWDFEFTTILRAENLHLLNKPSTSAEGYDQYTVRNEVVFRWKSEFRPSTTWTDTDRVSSSFKDRNEQRETIPDESVFSKQISGSKGDEPTQITAAPGEPVTVDFNFRINDGDVDPVRVTSETFRIVDHIDPRVFAIRDVLAEAQENISGTYGDRHLTAEDFIVTANEDDDLEIRFSDSFLDSVAEGEEAGRLIVNLPLTTRPITGKQIVDVNNEASFFGSDILTDGSYVSGVTARGETAGDGVHLRKTAYDPVRDEFSSNLRVPLDGNGQPTQEEFIYRVEVMPRGDFWSNRRAPSFTDELPEAVEWVGFVNERGETVNSNQVPLQPSNGNVVAEWINDTRTLLIKDSGNLPAKPDQAYTIYFKVRITDVENWQEGVGITNTIGRATSTFTPTNEYPLVIQKVDSVNSSVTINDSEARFTVTRTHDADGEELPTPELITEEAFVAKGVLHTLSDNGTAITLSVAQPGTYSIQEVTAPSGYHGTADEFTVEVAEEIGQLNTVVIENDPKTYAVGDYTWIDLNSDGIQDPEEPSLAGVTVELLDASGSPAVDVWGNPVAPVETDAEGRYVFDNLRQGEYQVKFTLTGENADRYQFTTAESGDAATDSDANVETNSEGTVGTSQVFTLGEDSPLKDLGTYQAEDSASAEFTASEGIDPTWDAGVVWRTGQVQLSKSFVDADGAPLGDADTAASFTWEATLPVPEHTIPGLELTGEVVVSAGEPVVIPHNFPVGTVVEFAEAEPTTIPDYDFGNVTFNGNPATVQSADEPVKVTAVNHYSLTPVGSFSVVKEVAGAEVPEGTTFTVVATWEGGSQTFELEPGVPQNGPELHVGTVVEISETGAPVIDRYTFESATITVDGEATDQLTIGDGAVSEVVVTNTYDLTRGSFTLMKELNNVSGDVAEGTSFPVTATWGDGPEESRTINLVPGVASEPLSLPVGTVVKLTEEDVHLHSHHFDSVIFTQNGVTLDDATFVVTEGEDPAEISVVNTYNPVPMPEAGFVHAKTSEPGSGTQVDPGDVITYILSGTNTGEADLTDVTLVDDLSEVLEGAQYNGDVQVSIEGVAEVPQAVIDGAQLTWTGDLAVGQEVVITYSVTVDERAYGTQIANMLTSSATPVLPDDPADPESPTYPGEPITPEQVVTVHPVTAGSVSVGDLVWVDENRDGRQDDGEPGIPGVVLEIIGPDGKPVVDVYHNPVGPVTTDSEGQYRFENLPLLNEGESYTVRIVQDAPTTVEALKPYVPTTSNVGDSDGDSSTWEASSKSLTETGEHDPSLDFGFVSKTYAIGDQVWIDSDRDGTQTESEFLEGVTVVLHQVDADGNLVELQRQETDSQGRYLFDELPAGEFQVQFILTPEQSELYQFTTPQAEGADSATDSDAGDDGFTTTIQLNDDNPNLTTDYEGEFGATQGVDPTWDAGVVLIEIPNVTVGDLVWVDLNKDGRQTEGEPGIPGVVLEILGPDGQPVTDVDGNPVQPVTTDSEGKYLFDRLPVLNEGEFYTVRIMRDHESTQKALAPYVPTQAGQGDRELDSSDWEATTQGLTAGGEQDLTLDFGFIESPDTDGEGDGSGGDGSDDGSSGNLGGDTGDSGDDSGQDADGDTGDLNQIPNTGADVLGLIAVAILALAAGVGILMVRRRRTT